MDTETEASLHAFVLKATKNRTVLIVAHRLSTVAEADRILVIRDGRIVEEGNHQELLDRGGFYAGLCRVYYGLGRDANAGLP